MLLAIEMDAFVVSFLSFNVLMLVALLLVEWLVRVDVAPCVLPLLANEVAALIAKLMVLLGFVFISQPVSVKFSDSLFFFVVVLV